MRAHSAAGAVIGSSGCGSCLGSPDASIYIGSPYVAAVAALTGVVAYMREHGDFPRVS